MLLLLKAQKSKEFMLKFSIMEKLFKTETIKWQTLQTAWNGAIQTLLNQNRSVRLKTEEKVGGVTIGALSWWAWWGRRWRGRRGGRGSWAAARWPRRQPAGCSSSWRGGGASERGGGWDWWLRPAPTTDIGCTTGSVLKHIFVAKKTHLNPAEGRKITLKRC